MFIVIKLNVKPARIAPVKKVAIALLLTCPFLVINILISNKVFAQSIVPANDLDTKVLLTLSN